MSPGCSVFSIAVSPAAGTSGWKGTDRALRRLEYSLKILKQADELTEIRVRGWALDDEEHVPGMRCVAAPIMEQVGHRRRARRIGCIARLVTR
ncbi:IclR family transcriptional regulator domain-containing protein [Rhizobium sp. 11515TR]|uniref:IclR family transcriptional regulator domain-containing protein n=1 Tax=Rhizobium sp. 11515TR TaxID=2028343 RepID=UPI00406C36AD